MLKIPIERIKESQCFFNVFETILCNLQYFDKKYKVAIGLVRYSNNLKTLFIHCYITNNNGEVKYDLSEYYLAEKPIEYINLKLIKGKEYFDNILKVIQNGSRGYINIENYIFATIQKELENFYETNNLDTTAIKSNIILLNNIFIY